MDLPVQAKWNRASRTYGFLTWGEEQRFGPYKRRLFAQANGRCLMVAAGTGSDFKYLPSGLTVTAIDISQSMLSRAAESAKSYQGSLELKVMDVQSLTYADHTFDSVITSCTFCSVSDPMRGLRELYRCIKPGGRLVMFEHVRSRIGPIAILQDSMTLITRRIGPDMNRETVSSVIRAGFDVQREQNIYLDVVKAIVAGRP